MTRRLESCVVLRFNGGRTWRARLGRALRTLAALIDGHHWLSFEVEHKSGPRLTYRQEHECLKQGEYAIARWVVIRYLQTSVTLLASGATRPLEVGK